MHTYVFQPDRCDITYSILLPQTAMLLKKVGLNLQILQKGVAVVNCGVATWCNGDIAVCSSLVIMASLWLGYGMVVWAFFSQF